ncbi:hypothetical protein [Clostridium lacusfryxellense]|uniref:hypothetical protein n=1 Tax=Clostridium lacusfryxellense TaxID=205328 RepID=UPI001C0CAF35|nr:hypothetical protein [Clostridium lacusfryxellense]MBU3113659.1 hypothetical protein [Clostridium lacusfryxellense]
MKTDDNRDKLRLIKKYFIFNMLQQPSCFININRTSKNALENNKQEKSTEFTPPIEDTIIENDSESNIPICYKLSMAKLLVTLKLLQQPRHNRNINKTFKKSPINIKTEKKDTENKFSFINSFKNKPNAKFMLFFKQVTFKNNSSTIKKKGEINTNSDDFYEIPENDNDNYFDSSKIQPIVIEEEDISNVPNEKD